MSATQTPKLDAALLALIPKLKALDETIGAIGYEIPISASTIRALNFRARIHNTLIELENYSCTQQSSS
jgi:hypothetical protein